MSGHNMQMSWVCIALCIHIFVISKMTWSWSVFLSFNISWNTHHRLKMGISEMTSFPFFSKNRIFFIFLILIGFVLFLWYSVIWWMGGGAAWKGLFSVLMVFSVSMSWWFWATMLIAQQINPWKTNTISITDDTLNEHMDDTQISDSFCFHDISLCLLITESSRVDAWRVYVVCSFCVFLWDFLFCELNWISQPIHCGDHFSLTHIPYIFVLSLNLRWIDTKFMIILCAQKWPVLSAKNWSSPHRVGCYDLIVIRLCVFWWIRGVVHRDAYNKSSRKHKKISKIKITQNVVDMSGK